MDHPKAIYLRLSPEFGEYRFGPYENMEVTVGSGKNCSIIIEEFGALPIHAKLFIEGEKELILSPSERSAEVFLWRDNKRPELIHGATAVKPNDAFSIVTERGPKFIVELDELPVEIKEQREKEASRQGTGRSRLSADSMKKEGMRQLWTQLLVMGPMQLLQRAWIYIKSGAIFQPRNIIAGAVLFSGWIVGGRASCSSKKMQTNVTRVETKLDNCSNQLDFQKSLAENKNYTLYDAIRGVTRSDNLAQLLKKDKKLMSLVKEKSLALINRDSPDWLVKNANEAYARSFKQWIAAIRSVKDSSLDADTKNLLIWNINEEDQSNRKFSLVSNSKGDYYCARGIIQLTFRQSTHLGLLTKADASYKGNVSQLKKEAKSAQIRKTIIYALGSEMEIEESQNLIDSLTDSEFESEQLRNRSQQSCIYIDGADDRVENVRMIKKLQSMVGPKVKGLPDEENYLSSTSRLAKLYVADLEDMDFRQPNKKIKFQGTLSSSLESLDQQGKWVLEKTAKTIARSIVLPCKVTLEGEESAKEYIGGEDLEGLPDPVSCLVFDWKIRNE